jgi:hypothetical protein
LTRHNLLHIGTSYVDNLVSLNSESKVILQRYSGLAGRHLRKSAYNSNSNVWAVWGCVGKVRLLKRLSDYCFRSV